MPRQPGERLRHGLLRPQLRLRDQDRPHLALDARHFRQAEVVHLLRRHARAGLLAQQVAVVGVAVGQFPHAVVGSGPRQLLLEEGDQAAVGRHHASIDGLRTAHQQRGLLGRCDLGQRGQFGGEVRVQGVLDGGFAGEVAHAGEHPLDHEARRDHAELLALVQPFDHLIVLAPHLAQP